ncbi:MAG TPA: hypothetical protein VEI94_12575 [Candidatus Bathyarchaeia archaeon]|nr:hypothetical protein [Candidatus Bathyarchaeia archaeon]
MRRKRRRPGRALVALVVLALVAYVAWTYGAREWRHWRFRRALEQVAAPEPPGARDLDRDAATAREAPPPAPVVLPALATPQAVGSADALDAAPPNRAQNVPAESLSRDDRQELERVLKRANPPRAAEKKN